VAGLISVAEQRSRSAQALQRKLNEKGQLVAGLLIVAFKFLELPKFFLINSLRQSKSFILNAESWWAVQVSNLMF
jgi:hypothetical protein